MVHKEVKGSSKVVPQGSQWMKMVAGPVCRPPLVCRSDDHRNPQGPFAEYLALAPKDLLSKIRAVVGLKTEDRLPRSCKRPSLVLENDVLLANVIKSCLLRMQV